jgi:hypothetical protein
LGWTIEQYNAGNRFVGIESVTKYRNLLNHILVQSGSSKNGVRFLSTGQAFATNVDCELWLFVAG